MTTPALFINCFEVPDGREEEFFVLWSVVNRYMRQKPGFISNRLHRATTPDARYRFVNYVQWATPDHWRAAHDDGFHALVRQAAWRDFAHNGAIYEIVSESTAEAVAA